MKDLKIKLYADGADLKSMIEIYNAGVVKGFTTNPSLMRKAGVNDYGAFAMAVVSAIPDLPVSFEVFSDDLEGMEREAYKIAGWGGNIYVKIPVTNTCGESTANLVARLSGAGLKLNVTALLTVGQVQEVYDALAHGVDSIVSVFAGRIADTGRDPVLIMKESLEILKQNPKAELLWASSRELLNIIQADNCGCHIITVTSDILKKLPMIGKSLEELSLDTVKMFYGDAKSAGYKI